MQMRRKGAAVMVGLTLLAACEAVDNPAPTPHDPASTLVSIETLPASLAPTWQVVLPSGSEITGRGDSTVTVEDTGDCWVLFDPVPGFRSPTPNPVLVECEAGRQLFVEGTWQELAGETGSIAIFVNPRVPGSRWVLQGPDGFYAAGRASVVLEGRAPGRYVASWSSPTDPAETSKQLDVLVGGGQIEMRPDDAPMETPSGTIRIDPNPDTFNATWELVESTGGYWSGSGDAILTDMPVGKYTLYWGPISGFIQPQPVVATLDPHAGLEFAVTYTTSIYQIGSARIAPDPAGIQAPWSLVAENGTTFTGVGDSTISSLPPLRYVVLWGAIPGYTTPAPTVGTLVAGAVLPFTTRYQPSGIETGTVHVEMQPAGLGATWSLEGPDGTIREAAGDTLLTGMPFGDYWMTWTDVAGYHTPLPNPVKLTLGGAQLEAASPQ